MATFTVQNLSGVKLAVPPPVAKILAPGATVEIAAASLDTDQIADLINDGKIGLVAQAAGSDGAAQVEAAPKANASLPTTVIGAPDAGVNVPDGDTLTFTHNLGTKPISVAVLDDATGAPLSPDATITIGGDANTVTVANGTGGPLDMNLVIQFPAGTSAPTAVAAGDASIAVA